MRSQMLCQIACQVSCHVKMKYHVKSLLTKPIEKIVKITCFLKKEYFLPTV